MFVRFLGKDFDCTGLQSRLDACSRQSMLELSTRFPHLQTHYTFIEPVPPLQIVHEAIESENFTRYPLGFCYKTQRDRACTIPNRPLWVCLEGCCTDKRQQGLAPFIFQITKHYTCLILTHIRSIYSGAKNSKSTMSVLRLSCRI